MSMNVPGMLYRFTICTINEIISTVEVVTNQMHLMVRLSSTEVFDILVFKYTTVTETDDFPLPCSVGQAFVNEVYRRSKVASRRSCRTHQGITMPTIYILHSDLYDMLCVWLTTRIRPSCER